MHAAPNSRTHAKPSPKSPSSYRSVEHLDTAADRRRQSHRDIAELLVIRADLLTDTDRALITAVYRDNLATSDVAALLGHPHTPRSIRRRLRALVNRILSPRFELVMNQSPEWPPLRRRIAQSYILEGRTLRDTAKHLRTTLHVVRTEMAVVEALINDATLSRAG